MRQHQSDIYPNIYANIYPAIYGVVRLQPAAGGVSHILDESGNIIDTEGSDKLITES